MPVNGLVSYYLQIIHFHRPLAFRSADTRKRCDLGQNPLEFVGAVCPGFELDAIDWMGCGMDPRAIADANQIKRYSETWNEALGN